MKRTLSVIIPVRNHAAPLRRLLRRLAALKPPAGWDVEIVVGYQQSTEPTRAVIAEAGVQCVEDPGLGPSSARNAAVAAASGHLLYFIDADASPVADDHFERLLAAAAAFGRFGAFGGPVLLSPAQRFNPIAQADHLACWFMWPPLRARGRSDFQPGVNIVMPRFVFERLGGFDEDMRVLEDFDFSLKLHRAGLPVFFEPGVGVYHEARGGLIASLRHSWYWGVPAREAFYARVGAGHYRHASDRRRFWINFPRILTQRLRVVLRVGWRQAPLVTLVSLPFLLLTVTTWAVAVCAGKGQPRGGGQAPARE